MVEIRCTSCQTRYRIDERTLPDETPTFKCSRCGHVFSGDFLKVSPRPAAASEARPAPQASDPSVSERYRPATPIRPRPLPIDPLAWRAAERQPRDRVGDGEETPGEGSRAFESESGAGASENKAPAARPQPDVVRPRVAGEKGAEAIDNETAESAPANAPVSSAGAPQGEAGGPAGLRPRNEAKSGENLRFDFGDDPELERNVVFDRALADDWKVGDELSPLGQGDSRAPEPAPRAVARPGGAPALKRARIPDEAAFLERGRFHSAGFFLGLFFGVALIFTAVSLMICGAPAASADWLRRLPVLGPEFRVPAPLESMVGLEGVRASYEAVKDGHRALVVSGVVRNGSAAPLHVVEVGARLLDARRRALASGAAYCGNALSRKMVAEMTPHEIEFLERLDPPKSFVLGAADSAPFLLVFIDPPAGLSRFSLAVSKAAAALSEPVAARNF